MRGGRNSRLPGWARIARAALFRSLEESAGKMPAGPFGRVGHPPPGLVGRMPHLPVDAAGGAKFAGAESVGEMTARGTPAHFATPETGNGSKTLARHARQLKNHYLLLSNLLDGILRFKMNDMVSTPQRGNGRQPRATPWESKGSPVSP